MIVLVFLLQEWFQLEKQININHSYPQFISSEPSKPIESLFFSFFLPRGKINQL